MLLPITAREAPGAMEIGVLDILITPPGVTVWPATTNWEAALAVYDDPSNVKTGVAGTGYGTFWTVFDDS